jgi:SAM-dependent methyltransferase
VQHRIEDIGSLGARPFDAAFSDFGALNCVTDLDRAARGIQQVLRPGGVLVASVIGRLCPWEIAVYLSRGDLGRAFVRWRGGMVPVPLGDGTVWTQYFTPGRLVRTFANAGFTREHVAALALCAPPPYLESFAVRHETLISHLFAADDRIGNWPVVRAMGDHFIVVLRRD